MKIKLKKKSLEKNIAETYSIADLAIYCGADIRSELKRETSN